jgi:peptidoglycan/LPS O-acetylase OafA/YrhL
VKQPQLSLNNLDVLRAIAAMCVLLAHVVEKGLKLTDGPVINQIGRFGVLVFFVHTSVVLLRSLDRSPEGGPWSVFYVRRLFRIYPLCVATITLVIGINVLLTSNERMPTMDLLANILLIQNLTGSPNVIGPLWSLPYEVQMYLALPYLHGMIGRGVSLASIAVLWTAVTGVNLVVTAIGGETITQYIPCFLAGALAHQLLKRKLAILPGAFWPLGICAAIVPAVLSWSANPTAELIRDYLTCLVIAVAIGYVKEMREGPLVRASRTVAKYSYGIYLLHMPILWFAFQYMRVDVPAQLFLFTALCSILPWIGYRLIEEPMIAIGRRITKNTTDSAHTPVFSACVERTLVGK